MKHGWIALAALAGTAATSAADAAPASHQAAAKDWTRTVALTADGGYRMGNPAAKVKLVEYGSLTCSHCGHFAAEGTAPLRALVKTGRVSFEYRNFILNGVDVAASVLSRCGGAGTFFPIVDSMYASQKQWVGAFVALDADKKAAIAKLPMTERLPSLAEAAGLDRIALRAGLPAAKARQCLGDETRLAELDKLNARGVALGVTGTPTFFIDGQKVDAMTWPELEPDIRAALRKPR